MFVFKAAVVGAGTMGGQIAQTIAAAGIPVVLKDIRQDLVDAGLAEARSVTEQQAGKLVEKGQAHRGAGRRAGRGDRSGCITRRDDLRGVRRRRLRHRGRARADGDQAGRLRRARRVHAGPRDPRLEHLVAVDHRDRRGDAAARQGRRLPLLLPGVDHAADRDRRGRRHVGGDAAAPTVDVRPGDQEAADHLRRGARASSSTGSSTRASREIWRAQEERDLSIKAIDEGVGAAERRPGGPVLPGQPARARHRAARRRAPARVLRPSASTSPTGMQQLVAEGKLGAKTGGDGFYAPRRRAEPRRATASPTSTSSSSC